MITRSDVKVKNNIYPPRIVLSVMRRRKVKRVKKAAKPKVDLLGKAVAREARRAEALIELDLGELYSILGAQVKEIRDVAKLARAKVPRRVDKTAFFIQSIALAAEPLRKSGEEFLKRYWGRILTRACRWWPENKEKFAGRRLIANLAQALAPAIPARMRTGSLLTLIAAMLVKQDLDKLCEERPETPPGVEVEEKVEEKVEEVVEKPAEEVEAVEEVKEEKVEEEKPAEEAPEERPPYTL